MYETSDQTMPSFDSQRAAPPTEVSIKESWLAEQREQWQLVNARRREFQPGLVLSSDLCLYHIAHLRMWSPAETGQGSRDSL